ncbi:MAG TPA: PQQ-dependent sugar dehydrogenase [Opitutaceae bacterium]|nr:PQQ-dependent sugar dehydrogenase [Opitutaceae bacterium]
MRIATLSYLLAGTLLGTDALHAQLPNRVAASTLSLPSALPTSTYSTERVYAPLSFVQPVALVSPSGDKRRLFVVEKPGRIWVIPDVTTTLVTRSLFLDLTSRVATSSSANDERGLLALAFHPQYASNGYFYVWYTTTTTTTAGSGAHNRLSRFTAKPGASSEEILSSEQPLLSQRDEAGNHNGGELLFGPDGYLYLSLGDEGGGNDAYNNSQKIDHDFFAGIVRIDVDQRAGSLPPSPHPAVHAGTYAVPPDNPFVGATSFLGQSIDPSRVRSEFWAVGLRNPWRMAFDSANGELWCADVGQGSREEVNLITRGGNYGWSYREGTQAGPRANPPSNASFIAPIWEYGRSEGQSITGGLLYRGNRLPALHGHYLFADFASGRIWSLRPNGSNPVGPERVSRLALDTGVSSFGLDPATGDVLIADLLEGVIKRLSTTPATGATPLPATLSQTGAFTDLRTLAPAPGWVAYEPRVSFWSDYAKKKRWFALRDLESTFRFAPVANWTLPTGAVWMKHFDLEMTEGDPSSSRRIETRFLVKTETGAYGVTYRWNEAQTDATLVPEDGADQVLRVSRAGVVRDQTWRYPSRSECLMCHTSAGGYALGFNTRQLNHSQHASESTPFLSALASAGYFSLDARPPSEVSHLPSLAPVEDRTASLELRARSYLDANCSHCHQPGGPSLGSWDARATTPLEAAGLLHGPLVNSGGNPSNRVIVPSDLEHSHLLHRIRSRGADRMPPIGSNERDRSAERLLSDWIISLGSSPRTTTLANLSARAVAGSEGQVLITGFILEGATPKTVLIRAVGPGLQAFDVPSFLPDPRLHLFRNNERILSNTGWTNSSQINDVRAAAQRVGAFSLASGSADSALLVTLNPGSYTAHAEPASGSPGVALIEVYDADLTPGQGSTRMINVSIRAHVRSGASTLIPGLIRSHGLSQKLLIRAIGPGLAEFNVARPLSRPVLQLYEGSDPIAANQGWTTSVNASAIRAATSQVGAFALGEESLDSAVVVTLGPGPYTVHVSSADGSEGIALVEFYEVP